MTIDAGLKPEGAPERSPMAQARPLGLKSEALIMKLGQRSLVTGGAGFLGSRLRAPLGRWTRDSLVENFYTGTRQNVHRLLSHPRFELMRHYVCFPLYVEVDEIYNLACPPHRTTTRLTQFRRPRRAFTARLTCWVWPSG